MMSTASTTFIVALISLMIEHQNAGKVSFGSTRGCDTACQRECIEVINKYRLNHQAKAINFSQDLADKAQKWADGGRFGYDMKSRGKYGQLIEWDVKDELQNFTTVIKHWHDKERDFDFASGRSKTGKTLHDFTQIVWKKARSAGCGQSEIFGSKYYVVWMDSDGVVSPDMGVGAESIGSPAKNDLHWYESAITSQDSSKRKPTYVVPSRLREEPSSTRALVEPTGAIISATGNVRSVQSKEMSAPDLNEVQEEQKVLNNNAMLKQYLYNDNLNNVVFDENKETASYHVVPGAKQSANWQKGAESFIQLEKNKSNTNREKQVNNDDPASEEDDRKQAARFQSLVIQDDDLLTKDEGDDNETLSSGGNGGDDLGEADENKQAAAIQSMMKQEDDMIQNEDDDEDEESSGNNSTVDAAVPSEDTNSKATNNNTFSKADGKPTSFYASGIALNNNPNKSAPSESNEKPSLDSTGHSLNSSLQDHRMINKSSIDNHQENSNGSPSNNSLTNEQIEHKAAGLMESSSTTLNDQTGGQMASRVSTSQSEENKMEKQQTKVQQSETTDAVETGAINTNGINGNTGGKGLVMASTANILTSQNGIQLASKPQAGSMATLPNSQEQVHQLADMMKPKIVQQPETTSIVGTGTTNTNVINGNIGEEGVGLVSSPNLQMASTPQVVSVGMVPNSQGRVHLAEKIKPQKAQQSETTVGLVSPPNVLTSQMSSKPNIGSVAVSPNSQSRVQLTAKTKPGYLSDAQTTSTQTQQAASPTMAFHPMSTALNDRNNQDSLSGQTTRPNAARPSTDTNTINGGTSVSGVHHVTSPAMITLPSTSSRPIKLVFHVKDMQSKGMSAGGSEAVSAYQSTLLANDVANNMNDDECHDDTLQCHLWAYHGHCKGIAYTEFMKRHCKATCGYCGLPSMIKESAKHVQAQASNLAQDEPCEDALSYEFSCPRWQAQGYCEKRQKEMKLVCRKTCGFCVTRKPKSRPLSSSFQLLPVSSEAGVKLMSDKSNSNMEAPTISRPKPTLNDILKNSAPQSAVQTLNSSPLKLMENVILQNSQRIPTSSSQKAVRPLGSSVINQNENINTKNTNEAAVVSAQNSHNEQQLQTTGSSTLKKENDKPKVVLNNLNRPPLKQQATTGLANKPKIPGQKDLKAPGPLPSEHKANNFIKAPGKVDLKPLSLAKPQVAASSFNKHAPSQQFSSQDEDKAIEYGIKALQQRLQAPLEISAVAKSKTGCGKRLCKEKVKTQQAKTRQNIDNRGSDVFSTSKPDDRPVATKGCDIKCQQECLGTHNRYRLNHGAPPLKLDQTLADQAQQWADKKVFKHSPWAGGQGGESIALGSLYPSFTAAVKAWHDEEKDYDWSTGKGEEGMKVNHFTQVVWKGAHLLGCGKTFVNGEPYYIAQMDTPGVIAAVPGFDKSNVGQPKEPDLKWFMNSSPYWKEMQTKDSIPKNIEHRIL